jgi:type IV pilus assembly protein PilV
MVVNNNGVSILEVLIGLVILAIGLLAIAGMQVTAISGNDFAKNITQATVLAQERIEILRNFEYTDSALSAGTYNEGFISGTIFTRQYVIVDIGTTMKKIIVTVSWTDRIGSHSIALETVRAK